MRLHNVSPCEVINTYLILGQSDKLTHWMGHIDKLPKQDKYIWTFTFNVGS